MADTGNTTEGQAPESTDTPEAPVEDAKEVVEPTGENTDGAAPQDAGDGEPDKWAGIPEDHWVRKELEDVRREAAAHRTKARDLSAQLEGAKSPEEVQQIIDEYSSKVAQAELKAAKLSAGRKFELPDELIARLQGENEEELLADAERLAPFAPKVPRTPTPIPPSGGRNPREGSDELTPEELYAKTQKSFQRRF